MELNLDYVLFVEEQINKYKEYAKLKKDTEVTPEFVNRALAEYQEVNLMLTLEYERAKIHEYEVNREYQKWYDIKFCKERRNLVETLENKKIKHSITEIEAEVRNANAGEYWKWQDKIKDAEYKTRFWLRLVNLWANYDSILNTLSYNMNREMKSLSIDNRFNAVSQVRKIRESSEE